MVLVPPTNPPGPCILPCYLIFIGIRGFRSVKVHGLSPCKKVHFVHGSNCNALIKLAKSMISPIRLRFIHSTVTQVKYGNIATRYSLTARYPRPDGLSTMISSLLYKVRTLPADLRRKLLCYWLTRNTGDLFFFALVGLPIVTLGLLFRFAYTDHIRIESAQRRHADLTCLAGNIYFEARGEPLAGQYAVAEVTMNRVASARFPGTVCEVVHEKRWDTSRQRYVGAFSWTELESVSWPKGIAWQRAIMAAVAVYDEQETPRVPGDSSRYLWFWYRRRIRRVRASCLAT